MERRAAEPIKYLGMDKKSIGGGHRHATMLNNLEGGRVWEVLPDASKRMLRDSWEFYLAAAPGSPCRGHGHVASLSQEPEAGSASG